MENTANLGGEPDEPVDGLPLDPFADDVDMIEMVNLLGAHQPGASEDDEDVAFSGFETQFNDALVTKTEPDMDVLEDAFSVLDLLETRESLPYGMLVGISGEVAALATSDKVARDAKEILEKIVEDVTSSQLLFEDTQLNGNGFYSRVNTPYAFCDTLATLAKVSAINDDIDSVKQYCSAIEAMPPEYTSVALATAYFAAMRLGDADSEVKLSALLTSENVSRFTKLKEYPGYIFNQGEDRASLTTVVRECALLGLPGSSFIDIYTTLNKNTDSGLEVEEIGSEIVDEESRWSLNFAQLQFQKIHENSESPDAEIDRMLGLLIDGDTSGLSQSFIWAVIPDAYKSTDNAELRMKLVRKFLDSTLHITAPGTIVIERVLSTGNSLLEDEDLLKSHPDVLTEVDNTLSLVIRSLQSEASLEVRNTLSEIYKGLHVPVLIREGLSAEEVLDYIELEHQNKTAKTVDELSRTGEPESLEAIMQISQIASNARNFLLSSAAVQFATYGEYTASQLVTSKILDPEVRLHTYAASWSHAEKVSDVVTMAPDDIVSILSDSDDTAGDIPAEPILDELYETAKVTSSNNLRLMAERLSVLIPRVAREERAGTPVNIGIDTRQLQLNSLVERMSQINPIIGRNSAVQLVESRINGNQRYNTNHMQQSLYDTMLSELDGQFLSAIRAGIIRTISEPWEVRASRLANYALKLRQLATQN